MSKHKPVPSNSRKARKYRGTECLNCGQPLDLSDIYCPYCSQLNSTKQLSFKDFFAEFAGSIVTYDSRLRYTLKDLLFSPGTITKRYAKGERLKYANPFRFFLSVSIIYFILQSLITTFTGESAFLNFNEKPNEKEVSSGKTGNNFKLYPNKADSLKVDSILQKNEMPNQRQVDSILKEKISGVKKDTLETYEYISEKSLDTLSRGERLLKRFSLYNDFYETTKIKSPTVALDSLKHLNTSFNRWAYEKNNSLERIKENPTAFVLYLAQKTPFFLFFFTPIYAFFFWFLYSRKKYSYMEHTVFIFHIFSFVFLGMIISLLPDLLLGFQLFSSLLFILVGPFYFYKALRNFYRQNRFITIVKFVFLSNVFLLGAGLAAFFFFLATAAFY